MCGARSAPNPAEAVVSDSERAEQTSASARSTHVVHLIAASWPEVAARVAPLVARVDRALSAVQVLVLVPTGDDATELMREVAALSAAANIRVAPLAAPRRARRLAAAAGTPQVVIGTVDTVSALIKAGLTSVELSKMAVTERCQGLGIGRRLLLAAIAQFTSMGATQLFLESSSKLKPALALYKRYSVHTVFSSSLRFIRPMI